MCEVTIVIPNYKGKEYLFSCVKSLYEKDQTENNIGIEKTDTPYVILLNNDTVIKDNYVKYLLDSIKKDSNIFSVEPKMIQYHDPSKIDSAGTYYNALGWAYAYGKDKSVKKYNNIRKIFAACGGASIYRKKVFEEIGMFDEKHFAYLEDIDVGYRARIAGYDNLYEPKSEVIHVGSAASGARYNEFKVKMSSRNNVYLIYKIHIAVKGYGKLYVNGIKEGLHMGEKSDKVKYESAHLKNYIKIQIELWINIFRRLA